MAGRLEQSRASRRPRRSKSGYSCSDIAVFLYKSSPRSAEGDRCKGVRMRSFSRTLVAVSGLMIFPAAAFAQVALAGTVKDTSGAVLPGVTIEASSSVLIEKTRTALTDTTGQYRIESLQPGTYIVTFTLAGFSTLKRDDVIVSGTGVVKIDAEMKVGAVAETVTVTGESPVVDVQSTRR